MPDSVAVLHPVSHQHLPSFHPTCPTPGNLKAEAEAVAYQDPSLPTKPAPNIAQASLSFPHLNLSYPILSTSVPIPSVLSLLLSHPSPSSLIHLEDEFSPLLLARSQALRRAPGHQFAASTRASSSWHSNNVTPAVAHAEAPKGALKGALTGALTGALNGAPSAALIAAVASSSAVVSTASSRPLLRCHAQPRLCRCPWSRFSALREPTLSGRLLAVLSTAPPTASTAAAHSSATRSRTPTPCTCPAPTTPTGTTRTIGALPGAVAKHRRPPGLWVFRPRT